MSTSEYLDCEIHLTDYDQAALSVAERNYSGKPNLDQALERRLLESELDAIQYGTFLFTALLPRESDLLAGYREGFAIAQHEDKRLRLHMRIALDAPKLHDLHWELLYDPWKRVALGRSRDTALSRFLDVPVELRPPVDEKPRLLVVLSTPDDLDDFSLPGIDRDELQQSVERALAPLRNLAVFEFLEGPATPGRIRQRLRGGTFHALHLCAHGFFKGGRQALVLEDENRQADFVEEERFSQLFDGEKNLRLITLVACHAGAQPRSDPFSGLGRALVAHGFPAVLAMRHDLSVKAAASFTEHFYYNLALSGQVDTAANEARQQMYLASHKDLEWGTPTLFMRLKAGLLWKPQKPRPIEVPDPESPVDWGTLLRCIHQEKILPILGPGICRGLLPSSQDLSIRLAEGHQYPLDHNTVLPDVAQYVETMKLRFAPHREILEMMVEELLEREQVGDRSRLKYSDLSEVINNIAERHFDRDAREPHRRLAELPIANYLTTNYDSFMLEALKWQWRQNKQPQRRACNWRNSVFKNLSDSEEYKNLGGTIDEPLVFHLYGNDQDARSLVLTEDDHLDFLGRITADENLIPPRIRGALTDSMLLFLGYDLGDLDCRVLFRGLIANLENAIEDRVAVLQVHNFEQTARSKREFKSFTRRYCRNMRTQVYWGSVREFVIELSERWAAKYAT